MKLRDSSGEMNYTVPVSNGLLKPEHVARMGDAVWLELLLEDLVTTGEGEDGLVLGSRPVCDHELAARLGLSRKTIARYRATLAGRYIVSRRKAGGHIYRVLKSKKWLAIRHAQLDRTVHLQAEQVDKSVQLVGGASGHKRSVQLDTNGEFHKETNTVLNTTPYPEGFEVFWNAYPKGRKVARPRAIRAWRKIKPSERPAVYSGLEAWKRSDQWVKERGRYIPHPSRFLNDRMWEDVEALSPETPGAEELPRVQAPPWRRSHARSEAGRTSIAAQPRR